MRLREAVEPGAESHLRECVDAARHERFPAELARKVGVTLEERDADAAPGEQVGEGGASGPGADDDNVALVHGARLKRRGSTTGGAVCAA